MLDRVRDVNLFAINSRFFERAIHDFSRGADERFAGDVFVIAWLFADEHDRRFFRAFAKNGLGCVLI